MTRGHDPLVSAFDPGPSIVRADDARTPLDGRAPAVVRPTGAGETTVTATAPGCTPVTVRLEAR